MGCKDNFTPKNVNQATLTLFQTLLSLSTQTLYTLRQEKSEKLSKCAFCLPQTSQ